jgi:hypothetical protein
VTETTSTPKSARVTVANPPLIIVVERRRCGDILNVEPGDSKFSRLAVDPTQARLGDGNIL